MPAAVPIRNDVLMITPFTGGVRLTQLLLTKNRTESRNRAQQVDWTETFLIQRRLLRVAFFVIVPARWQRNLRPTP